MQEKRIDGLDATARLAARLAREMVGKAGVLYLSGDLGAGKTAFTRFFLRELGYKGAVKSPTYTLVECYEPLKVNHFDFYRLADPEELEFIGFEHYFGNEQINIIEWPENGAHYLPKADISITLEHTPGAKEEERTIKFESYSEYGKGILQRL